MTYAYVRVSTDKQDVESQKIGIERKAKEINTVIDEWVEDNGVSGTKEYKDRELGELMDKLKDGDVIIVSEISRLARSVFMLFRIVEHCTQKIDCVIYAVKENQMLKKNDVVSAIILSAYGTAAQIEREMIVKRTREGIERRKKDGVVFGRPIGAKSAKINPKYEAVKDQVRDYLSKGLGPHVIAKLLNMHRSAIAKIIKIYNFDYVKRETNNPNESPQQRILKKEKPWIEKMIKEGLLPKVIHERLLEKGYEISHPCVLNFIKSDEKLYELLKEKNKELRAVANKDCGKNKQHYRF